MENNKGKIAVVTGASGGIGSDICVRLANYGLIVIGLARQVKVVEELSEKIDSNNDGKIFAIKCDLEVEKEILEAFQWIEKEFGAIHIFINNAGVFLTNFLIESETEIFRKSFDVNVIAGCICLREAVKNIKAKSEKAHIFVINRYMFKNTAM